MKTIYHILLGSAQLGVLAELFSWVERREIWIVITMNGANNCFVCLFYYLKLLILFWVMRLRVSEMKEYLYIE